SPLSTPLTSFVLLVLFPPPLPLSPLFFFLLIRRPLTSTLFPYTTLFRSPLSLDIKRSLASILIIFILKPSPNCSITISASPLRRDRKSTRLNSSHVSISYAVFCLKKKNTRTCYDSARRRLRGVVSTCRPS